MLEGRESFIARLCSALESKKFLQPGEGAEVRAAFMHRSAITFEDFLIEEEILEKSDLLPILSELYECPAIDVVGEFFDHNLVTMFPKDILLRSLFIPYEHDGDILIVIAAYPDHADLPATIGQYVSYDVTCMVGLARDICDSVKEFYDTPPTYVHDPDMVPENEERPEHDAHDIVDHNKDEE